MAHIRTKAFVLSEITIGEADKLLNLLTPEQGLITARARGANRPRSVLAAVSQPLVLAEFELFSYKGRYTVDSATLIEPFLALRENLDALFAAIHLGKIVIDLLRDDAAAPSIYTLWAYTLHALTAQADPQQIVHFAQIRLLSECGFTPWLQDCVRCHQPVARPVPFCLYRSGVLCEQHAAAETHTVNRLQDGTLQALLHAVISPPERLYQVSLSRDVREQLGFLSARYLEEKMEKRYETLQMTTSLDEFAKQLAQSRGTVEEEAT